MNYLEFERLSWSWILRRGNEKLNFKLWKLWEVYLNHLEFRRLNWSWILRRGERGNIWRLRNKEYVGMILFLFLLGDVFEKLWSWTREAVRMLGKKRVTLENYTRGNFRFFGESSTLDTCYHKGIWREEYGWVEKVLRIILRLHDNIEIRWPRREVLGA